MAHEEPHAAPFFFQQVNPRMNKKFNVRTNFLPHFQERGIVLDISISDNGSDGMREENPGIFPFLIPQIEVSPLLPDEIGGQDIIHRLFQLFGELKDSFVILNSLLLPFVFKFRPKIPHHFSKLTPLGPRLQFLPIQYFFWVFNNLRMGQ